MTAASDNMAPVKVPANLPELVRAAFNRARTSGDVHFFPTQVALVSVNSVPFQLRYSPALANKPRGPQPPAPTTDSTTPRRIEEEEKEDEKKQDSSLTDKKPKPFFDPFDNPPKAMLVHPLPPHHNLVLNKFAIVPEHFILATQAFKPQTHLLEKTDLDAAYACIEAYHADRVRATTSRTTHGVDDEGDQGSELYVFFNSGAASGSSQPHRHVQMLPVERMREGLSADEERAWEVLAGELVREEVRGRVPMVTFAERLGRDGEGADLEGVYLRLYRRACEAVLGSVAAAAASAAEVGVDGGGDGGGKTARVDYNLAMTRDVMVIAPRVAEGTTVSAVGEDGGRREVGQLALNGTVLAGTALVKTQEEWDALRAEPEQLLELLGRIGLPNIQAPPLL